MIVGPSCFWSFIVWGGGGGGGGAGAIGLKGGREALQAYGSKEDRKPSELLSKNAVKDPTRDSQTLKLSRV